MKARYILKHLRPLFRLRKKQNPTELGLSVLKAIRELEQDNMLLVISDKNSPGLVLSGEMSNYFNICYLIRMQHYTKVWGMERFLDARMRLRKFGKAHNPDEELLNLCRNVRMTINFRRAASTEDFSENDELKPSEPLFITYMNETLTEATHVGYEVNGVISLSENTSKSENMNK